MYSYLNWMGQRVYTNLVCMSHSCFRLRHAKCKGKKRDEFGNRCECSCHKRSTPQNALDSEK
jgi:hypothetical protein